MKKFPCPITPIIERYSVKVSWLPGIVTRIAVGWVFIEAGWGKLQNIPKVVEFFSSLGIPAPQIQAPFVAGVEFIGGIMVLIGLFTRVFSIPLMGTMVVAILTAKKADIHSASDLYFLPEFTFLLLLLWLVCTGAGTLSIDTILKRRCQASANGS